MDCGGEACLGCAEEARCERRQDCASGVCMQEHCAAPTCADLIQNGDETGEDCGGACPGCASGLSCAIEQDCQSGVCESGVCLAPSCDDGLQNGAETGVDCGGGCWDCVRCAAHPIPAKTSWTASASDYFVGNTREVPALAVDGSATRWSSGKPQAGKEWLEVDFGTTTALDTLVLDQGEWTSDYPRAYQVRLSSTARNFSAPVVAVGTGAALPTLVIRLSDKTAGRYLLITQTGVATSWWTVSELSVSCAGE